MFRTRLISVLAVVALAGVAGACGPLAAQETSEREVNRAFTEKIRPLLQTYCYACHGKEKTEGKLDLSAFSTLEKVAQSHATWEAVRERLLAGEMPPEDARRRPSPAERQALISWISDVRIFVARRSAGDPGIVPV